MAGTRGSEEQTVLLGLLLSGGLIVLGLGAGWRQVRLWRQLQQQPFLPAEDRQHFRSQARRRLIVSVLLTLIGGMIGVYYLSGMDERLVAIPQRQRQAADQAQQRPLTPEEQAEVVNDRRFTRLMGYYWISIIVLLGAVVMLACLDVIATRRYWLARYRELQADHQVRLQRDLAVFRQRRLQSRFRTLRASPPREGPSPDDTPPP
ncbi:MAG: hypothetical protein NZ703_05745 [Gemmataceae bacterium]|nr:hypothetical protein [Gemmataceae bacterium]MCS7270569.1 hypothetical protein [Gemmataceae bacterium]MDW8242471.1 hypothetical protein [Thermogemmata sp.]